MKEMAKQRGSPCEAGQAILILILVMTVALSIGLSVVQKSLVDVSTASKVEQSSRAFSAAEAGVEKVLAGNPALGVGTTNSISFTDNQSQARISDLTLIPAVPENGSRQVALELPPLAKGDVAQVWLADPSSTSNPPSAVYTQNTLDIYWGNSNVDKAALELTLVYHDGVFYRSRKWYLDHPLARNNGFDTVSCGGGVSEKPGAIQYQCKKTLGDSTGVNNGPLPSGLMLIRARLLYNSTSQSLAVQAVGTRGSGSCDSGGCWLPPHARSITSTGISGETQRTVKVFQVDKVVPSYLDYAIFSAGDITK